MSDQQSASNDQLNEGGEAQVASASRKKFCLLDASVILPYFLPKAHKNSEVHTRAVALIESVRSGMTNHFFYIPNFCIAEVFSAFAKYAYGNWNKQIKSDTIHGKAHKSLRKQFQSDIHNASLFYHYELTRYHVLAINLVAPVDHYFKLTRGSSKTVAPAGAFDQLIVAMGIHLTKIHGAGNVVVITADNRLAKLIKKCRSNISDSARRAMQLKKAEELVGIPFQAASFPLVLNFDTVCVEALSDVFGHWTPPVAVRYKRPYHLKGAKAVKS